jgi:hypothetical protein
VARILFLQHRTFCVWKNWQEIGKRSFSFFIAQIFLGPVRIVQKRNGKEFLVAPTSMQTTVSESYCKFSCILHARSAVCEIVNDQHRCCALGSGPRAWLPRCTPRL